MLGGYKAYRQAWRLRTSFYQLNPQVRTSAPSTSHTTVTLLRKRGGLRWRYQPAGHRANGQRRRIPALELVLFFISALCIAGSALVLKFSDQQPIESWITASTFVQPSVLLAILTGVFNAAQTFALSGGITIVWWRSISKGTTLSTLHYIWNKGAWMGGHDAASVLLNRYVAHVMWATAITVVASVASNPLLQ